MLRSLLLAVVAIAYPASAEEGKPSSSAEAESGKVYGEWRIQIRPDRLADYNRLIEQQGLPLFREAGGRMVGWWSTVVGDLYQQTTIWEYDSMVAFERARAMLGKDERFARFAAARDPLLAGESNRFLKLAPKADPLRLPETAACVVHERHRVALGKQREYLEFATGHGAAILKQHGFRPVGPWMTDVGKWSEVTWLFCFDSLAEREQLIAKFAAHADSAHYGAKLNALVDEIVTQVLTPAPVIGKQATEIPKDATSLLPHLEQVAHGVYVAGFADRYASANCGWFGIGDETWLVDLPRGISVPEFLDVVAKTTEHPASKLVLTQWQAGDETTVRSLLEHGVKAILTSAALGDQLTAVKLPADVARVFRAQDSFRVGGETIELIPCDGEASKAGAALYLIDRQVLFAGPLVTHGPRAPLHDGGTATWSEHLERLRERHAGVVVPGRGSWGGAERLDRQREFIVELRRQVGYAIAQGRPVPPSESVIPSLLAQLVWPPYDGPTGADLAHVYSELTVPLAPFNGRPPKPDDHTPHALVIIGDQPHEPGHIEDGLRAAFKETCVIPHIAVDVRTLSAENLAQVRLLVILRDGLQRPLPEDGEPFMWMTDEQQQVVVEFVEAGGGFLNLHNSMALYPADGAYLKLVGGAYTGHGPLERFRVEVVDREHPVTHGVSVFTVADEQHAPTYDEKNVHLLLQSRSDEGKVAAAGWVHEPGRGRLCHLASGHTREALLHPMYQRLLRNAIQWCLRRDSNS